MINPIKNFIYFHVLSKFSAGKNQKSTLSAKDEVYLKKDNPYLVELKAGYKKNTKINHSIWETWEDKIDLTGFRGEVNYLTQSFLTSQEVVRLKYALFANYVELTDYDKILDKLGEDEKFSVKLWEVNNNKNISRDLLDSVLEIYFVKEILKLDYNSSINVLDIGAGYGRFAYRFCQLFQNSNVYCIDPIATSSFLCDYYLKFRTINNGFSVPFSDLNSLANKNIQLATNIHSWSECTFEFICFWLDLLLENNVKYLMIVPHTGELISKETDNTKINYEVEILKRGYKLISKRRKFYQSDILEVNGIFPTNYFMFENSNF